MRQAAGRWSARRIETVEEIADVDRHFLPDLEQPARADTVGTRLVFLDLRIGNAERLGQVLLRHAQKRAAQTNARPDVIVDPATKARRTYVIQYHFILPLRL